MSNRKRIAIFAGTTEGRRLALKACDLQLAADVFVATEYGKEGLPDSNEVNVFCGRLEAEEMERILTKEKYAFVADATHPYARIVSENIRHACLKNDLRLIRVLRDGNEPTLPEDTVLVDTIEDAVEYLKASEGAILVTTGSKELLKYKELPDWESRIYARVLSLPDIVCECAKMGFYGKHLIAMQGPFSAEMNTAMLRAVKAKWLVTKDSGKAGGFSEKAEAVRKAGAKLIVIGRPGEQGISVEEAVLELERLAKTTVSEKRRISLIGAGPGDPELLTVKAKTILSESDVIIGAGQVVERVGLSGKTVIREYMPEKISEYIKTHPEYRRIAVIFSGDTGFYSGAKGLLPLISELPDIELTVLPGISSIQCLSALVGSSWNDCEILSLHGRDGGLVQAVRENKKVLVLSGGADTLSAVCRRLLNAGIDAVKLTVGENLSLDSQKLLTGSPRELFNSKTEALSVILIENPQGNELAVPGLKDEAFIRGKVPMTKREVRAVSVSMLNLTKNAVVYDVGAGTGSVSVECARLSDTIKVFAIERALEAVELLHANRDSFGLNNMEIVEGTAPEAIRELPAPTHVFIGGSGGNMRQIIRECLEKNPKTRFVINMITLESVAEACGIVKTEPVTDPEITQVFVSRSKTAGKSHLMMGQNPVWIMAFEGV